MILAFGAALAASAQDLPDLQLQDVHGNEVNLAERYGRWLLLTASEAGCSFTYTGVKKVSQLNCDNLDVIVLDYDTEERVKEIYEDFLEKVTFISDKNSTNATFRKQFSPQYQLYDPTGKLVWKAKGLKKLNIEKIQKFTSCSEN